VAAARVVAIVSVADVDHEMPLMKLRARIEQIEKGEES
jgi:hypothetical protein